MANAIEFRQRYAAMLSPNMLCDSSELLQTGGRELVVLNLEDCSDAQGTNTLERWCRKSSEDELVGPIILQEILAFGYSIIELGYLGVTSLCLSCFRSVFASFRR